jgi:glycosyltransferase involved in cell wall biosynthesis
MPAAGFKLKCSVILPVYTRKEFVNQALLSLENQDVDKNFFEVLIISNVEINLERSYNLNMQIVKSDRMTLAGKLSQGIILAKYDVVTFLEDDDLYCNDRISTILKCFGSESDLTYYHNASIHFRHTEIQKRIASLCSHSSIQKVFRIQERRNTDISRSDEMFLYKNQADYNLSSMALRKDFIIDHAKEIANLGTRSIDTFVFSIALYKGNSLLIDSKILTSIRINEFNASQSVELNRDSISNSRFSRDMRDLIAVFDSLQILEKRFVQSFIISRGFDDLMKSNNISRLESIVKLIELLKIYRAYFFSSDVAKKGIIYSISPRLMHKMITKFHKA